MQIAATLRDIRVQERHAPRHGCNPPADVVAARTRDVLTGAANCTRRRLAVLTFGAERQLP